jgi:predicted  nucleic acid-binding Zn-ribbon protein
MNFTNYYRCPRCAHEWEDRWSCACNDSCPECGLRDIEPYDYEGDDDSEPAQGATHVG